MPECTCDAVGDGPCPAHGRESRLQDELIALKNGAIMDDAEIRAECDVCRATGARKLGDLLLCGTCYAIESYLIDYLSAGGLPARAFVERALAESYGGGIPGLIAKECSDLRDLLFTKQVAYGNSALDPLRIMSKASPVEQILVRIDDKLSRLARGSAAGEDVELDLLGYLILLRVARHSGAKG